MRFRTLAVPVAAVGSAAALGAGITGSPPATAAAGGQQLRLTAVPVKSAFTDAGIPVYREYDRYLDAAGRTVGTGLVVETGMGLDKSHSKVVGLVQVALAVRGSQLVFTGYDPSAATGTSGTLALTGGTGRYAGVRGSATVRQLHSGRSELTITFDR